MTLEIKITVPEDVVKAGQAEDYLQRAIMSVFRPVRVAAETAQPFTADDFKRAALAGAETPVERAPAPEQPAAPPRETPPAAPAPEPTDARVYGQPPEGSKRRGKAEMEIDRAIETHYADTSEIPTSMPAAELLRRLQAGEDVAPQSNISTGEDRIDPANPDDAAEDAADEAAEAAGGTLTHDDLRLAVGAFAQRHGLQHIGEVNRVLGCGVEAVPVEGLQIAIDAIKQLTETFAAPAAADAGMSDMDGPAAHPLDAAKAAGPVEFDAFLAALTEYRAAVGEPQGAGEPAKTIKMLGDVTEHLLGARHTFSTLPRDPASLGKVTAGVQIALGANLYGHAA